MIALDTNVLVRYLTWDDAAKAARAAEVIEGAAERGETLFVSSIVVCEVVWVLEAAYGVPRADVLNTVDGLLRTAQLDFDRKDLLWQALADARRGRADFADCLIGREAAAAGAESVVTFDGSLSELAMFELL